MQETIHIALSANRDFTVPLGLCLRSIMQSAQTDTTYHFHILDSGVDRKLLQLGRFTNITWYDVTGKLRDLPCGGRFPTSIYHRFLLPQLLPDTIERVIYLDSDTVVKHDLKELYHTGLGDDTALAAVPWVVLGHYTEEFGQHLRSFPRRFGLPDDGTPYFYSSLLVMHLATMRSMQISQRLIAATRHHTHELIWPDQDVLNAVLRGQITALPQEYNVIPLFSEQLENESVEAKAAYAAPAIVHFAAMKPNILTGPRNKLEEDFFRFWQESPWSRCIPYPLISLSRMPKPVAGLLNASFKALIPWPRLLRAYGRLLAWLRGRKTP